MVIFAVCIFGRNDFQGKWLETLINRGLKLVVDFGISQKYNPKLPQNDTFSFLGKRFWEMGNMAGYSSCRRLIG